jgi:hypothetical protein
LSIRTQKQRDQEASQAQEEHSVPEKEQALVVSRDPDSENNPDATRNLKSIPRWRQIEIMRERAQLREALADLDAELDGFDELEEEVFGSESENEVLYQHVEDGTEDEVEFEDEELEDDGLGNDELENGDFGPLEDD